MSNAGKKRFWSCGHQQHHYDDFVNMKVCTCPNRKHDECLYHSIFAQQICPNFEKGKDSCYIKVTRRDQQNLDAELERIAQVKKTYFYDI